MKRRLLILGLTALFSATGCSRRVVEAPAPTTLDAKLYKDYFDTAVSVLRDNGFVIDRRDYRFGTITTRPAGAPTVFEPWNPHNTTSDQALNATLNDEQRIVEVTFHKEGAGTASTESTDDARGYAGGYRLEVAVTMQRRQVPTRRLAGSAQRNVFSTLAAPPRELRDKGINGAYWEPIGRDPLLEARLISQINERVHAGG